MIGSSGHRVKLNHPITRWHDHPILKLASANTFYLSSHPSFYKLLGGFLMKPALAFVLGALGLLTLAKFQRQGRRTRSAEQSAEEKPRRLRRGVRARGMGFRHRSQDGLLDLNSATIAELRELRGIGDVLAGRIIENRPYATKIDLIGRRIIPDSAYEGIKHAITVAHAA
jgi:Helix-hairpin-helix motif